MKNMIFTLGVLVLMLIINPTTLLAFGGGAGTCDVVADFSSITGMNGRVRNQTPGSYVLSTNRVDYNSFEFVEITLSANGAGNESTFTGIVVSVVDENGTKVGTFDFNTESEVHNCGGNAMAATHTGSHGNVSSRSLFWIPPSELVGEVDIVAYVLSGQRGAVNTQEFYRLVKGDGGITLIEDTDTIFLSGFE